MTHFLQPTYIISILIAIAVHEWAHAITAHRLGDRTAEQQGRLTLNPLSHIDPLGALMFVTVGFGWAKPVPVNPAYFRHPKRDMAITALAGPLSNLLLSIVAYAGLLLLLHAGNFSAGDLLEGPVTSLPVQTIVAQILSHSLYINLALMAFNLFPVAPLDGSNIVRLFIPFSLEESYESFVRIGPFVLLFLLLFESFLPFPLLSGWVHGIMNAVLSVFAVVAG